MTQPYPVQLLVLAKQPVAGRVKTRLSPALTPETAAAVARAALSDTLAAVTAAPVQRRVLVLEGDPQSLPCKGFVMQQQGAGGLGERLAAAFAEAYARCPLPMLLIGMDTPQVSVPLLAAAAAQLAGGQGPQALLGLAADGGWWALGLPHPAPGAFEGVPMSVATTGLAQQARLTQLGLDVRLLPVLRDVDHVDDIAPVAAQMPTGSAFARLARTLSLVSASLVSASLVSASLVSASLVSA